MPPNFRKNNNVDKIPDKQQKAVKTQISAPNERRQIDANEKKAEAFAPAPLCLPRAKRKQAKNKYKYKHAPPPLIR